MSALKDATAIAGIGQTTFAKRLPESEKTLACRAVLAALDDAGIEPSAVDAFASYTMEETDEVELAKAIGAGDVTFFSKTGYGGGGSCATVAHLAAAIATGQATVGVAWRSRKRGSGPRPWTNTAAQLPTPAQWTRPFGLLRPADEIAMLARRYLHEYGATRDHLFNVALACRNRANQNPAAVMYDRPLTREMYMTSRWISEPLCLFDNCLETDGALACVVVSAERARDCRRPPVYIHSAAQGLPAQHHGMVNYWNDDPLTGPAWTAARHLWKNADLAPEDIDVAQIYDAFTPSSRSPWRATASAGAARAPPSPRAAPSKSAAGSPSTPAAAASARRTYTASTSSPRASSNCAAPPPPRSRTPPPAWSRRARESRPPPSS